MTSSEVSGARTAEAEDDILVTAATREADTLEARADALRSAVGRVKIGWAAYWLLRDHGVTAFTARVVYFPQRGGGGYFRTIILDVTVRDRYGTVNHLVEGDVFNVVHDVMINRGHITAETHPHLVVAASRFDVIGMVADKNDALAELASITTTERALEEGQP